jgi:transcriptional regulator with XRE-family HTH domain
MNTLTGKKASYLAVIGVVLQEERDVRGVTQAAAATLAGITQSTWARLENGKACTIENLAKACKGFDLELWQLIKVADDRAMALTREGVIVVYETPTDADTKNSDEWIISNSQLSKIGLAALAGATVVGLFPGAAVLAATGITGYLAKAFPYAMGAKKP